MEASQSIGNTTNLIVTLKPLTFQIYYHINNYTVRSSWRTFPVIHNLDLKYIPVVTVLT